MKFNRTIERSVIAWADQTGYPNDLAPGSPEHSGAHEHLLGLTVEMESDFEPWGKRTRDDEPWTDCSCGCRHYAILAGSLGADWGVCMNQRSPRAGLLIFEHQGCPQFEDGPNDFDLGDQPRLTESEPGNSTPPWRPFWLRNGRARHLR